MDTPGLPGSYIDEHMTSASQRGRRHSSAADNQIVACTWHYEVALQSQNDLGFAGPVAGFALGLFGLFIVSIPFSGVFEST